jgi:H+/gluconate symporter-like permease
MRLLAEAQMKKDKKKHKKVFRLHLSRRFTKMSYRNLTLGHCLAHPFSLTLALLLVFVWQDKKEKKSKKDKKEKKAKKDKKSKKSKKPKVLLLCYFLGVFVVVVLVVRIINVCASIL